MLNFGQWQRSSGASRIVVDRMGTSPLVLLMVTACSLVVSCSESSHSPSKSCNWPVARWESGPPAGSPACLGNIGCGVMGSCFPEGDQCVLGPEEGCKRGYQCAWWGACEVNPKDTTECIVGTDSACATSIGGHVGMIADPDFVGSPCDKLPLDCSLACAVFGRCTPGESEFGATCLATSDADCAKSVGCMLSGGCALSASNNACVPKIWTDCWNSQLCQTHGFQCLIDKESCADGNVGGDNWYEQSAGQDLILPASEFEPSNECRASKSEGWCPESEYCRYKGGCGWGNGTCIPRDDVDCRRSYDCLEHGWCWRAGDRCGVRDDNHCIRCIGGSDPYSPTWTPWIVETIMANNCQSTGVAQGGRCVPHSDADCWHACFELGRCKHRDGKCVAKADADCGSSMACKLSGDCKVDLATGHCYSPDPSSCLGAGACKQWYSGCSWCPKSLVDGLPHCTGRVERCLVPVVYGNAP